MSTAPHIRAAKLRQRESATASMIREIDDKLSRLTSARRERADALLRIRAELVKSSEASPVGSENHERRD